jgi:hypothetical protein
MRQAYVDRDARDPGTECSVSPELGERSKGSNEGLLNQIVYDVRVVRASFDDTDDVWTISLVEL